MSEPADLVIHGGRIVSPETVLEASIAVRGGTIVAVGAADAMPEAKETFDAPACTSCPVPSTCTCTSGTPATPTRKISRAARPPRPSAA